MKLETFTTPSTEVYLDADTVSVTINTWSNLEGASIMVHGKGRELPLRKGVALGIISSLNALAKEREKEPTAFSSGMSLVAIKERAIAEKYREVSYRKSGTKISSGGLLASGLVDGKKVNVQAKAIESHRPRTLIQ